MTADQIIENYTRQVRGGLKIREGAGVIPHLALGLTGEAGEVADIVKKSQYTDGSLDYDHLVEELGDNLWYLVALADKLGLTIIDLMVLNIAKLAKRRPQYYTPIQADTTTVVLPPLGYPPADRGVPESRITELTQDIVKLAEKLTDKLIEDMVRPVHAGMKL